MSAENLPDRQEDSAVNSLRSDHNSSPAVSAGIHGEAGGDHFRAFVAATSDAVYKMSADWSELR